MNVRKVLLLCLVLVIAGAVAVLSSPGERPPPPPPPAGGPSAVRREGPAEPAVPATSVAARTEPFQRASECASCHADLYGEWQRSMHGQAWTDPMVRALSQGFRMTECIDCHAPMPIHVTGIDRRVAPRQHAREEGVDCLTCHLLDDGVSVAAAKTAGAADTSNVAGACRPVVVPVMGIPTVCAGCHNQHGTVDEAASSGVRETCFDCHMPPVARVRDGQRREGRSHVFPGGHFPEMHVKAAKLDLRVEDGAVVARVTNVGGGHSIPTDARHRSYNVFLSAWDDRGNPLVADRPMEGGEFRLFYRDQFKESTQIPHGKSREARWPVPEGLRGKAKVRLVYALNPEELAAGRVTPVADGEVSFP